MRGGHLGETTLLRRVVGDLAADERLSAERHLRRCASCRQALGTSERLDGALRAAGQMLAVAPATPEAFSADDPFARRPAAGERRASNLGFDLREAAQAAARATAEARDHARRLSSALSEDERQKSLKAIDLDAHRDRLALAYALDSLVDRIEEDPTLRRGFAGAVLERLEREGPEFSARTEPKSAAEYALPLADLRGRALLLSGAAALWCGDLEAARIHLLGAWEQFAAGRGSEGSFARVEALEALRRIVVGRHGEAAALGQRAMASFSITAHGGDLARATLAAGLAAWGAGRRREALALLRKSALGFGRAQAWSGFVTAACAAALSLLSDGRIEESRRAFRELRRRKARRAPLDDRMFVRETERIALLLGRDPSKGRKKQKDQGAFSAADAVLLRGASVRAENLVSAALDSDEKLQIALADLHGHPARGFALFYACQKGNLLVAQDPLRALELARGVFEEAKTLVDSEAGVRLSAPVPRETLQAETKILESASQVQLGYALDSGMAAVEAHHFFRAGGDVGFGLALADYYEGQAAGFARDYVAGEHLLKKELKVFAEFGQDNLMARAEAALATLYLQRGDEARALTHFDHAIDNLDPQQDAKQLAIALNNRGHALLRLRRSDEARISYARALTMARKLDARAIIQNVRNGLAELEFQRGQYDRALRAFAELARAARAACWKMEQLFADLYVAECLGRLGREEEMEERIIALRVERKANPFAPSPAMEELFDCLDRGMLDADVIAHVRQAFEDEAKGIRRRFQRLEFAG